MFNNPYRSNLWIAPIERYPMALLSRILHHRQTLRYEQLRSLNGLPYIRKRQHRYADPQVNSGNMDQSDVARNAPSLLARQRLAAMARLSVRYSSVVFDAFGPRSRR